MRCDWKLCKANARWWIDSHRGRNYRCGKHLLILMPDSGQQIVIGGL